MDNGGMIMKNVVMIVDDEPIMADELKTMLLEMHPEIHIGGIYHDGETALEKIKKLKPSIVFLDIQMPGMNGLEVAQNLKKLEHTPIVIFVTAFDEFAIKAFEVDAADYILKPLDENDLERVMKKAAKLLPHTGQKINMPLTIKAALSFP
jgi:DNA-binding LytR/AlgR family response regulator